MLSICIPTYNYDVRPLVAELSKQATALGIDNEILVADDCSSNRALAEQNRSIEKLTNVRLFEMPSNMGRSAIRNWLVKNAQFRYLLFLDCDTFPETSLFLKNYWDAKSINSVVIGGLAYRIECPASNVSLRWTYGHQRETILATVRSKNPYRSFMTGNFFIDKEVFKTLVFDESVVKYGHEDTLFGLMLEKLSIEIKHIDNRVFHDGLELNDVFIEKTKTGIETLYELSLKHPAGNEIAGKSKLLNTFKLIKKTGMTGLLANWFKLNEKRLVNALKKPNPNLRIFDWFKLGYLCQIAKKS